jgi:predicted ATPase
VIWDEQHLKALLRLRHYPRHLLDEEPWANWLHERRGANAVRASLRQAPLKPILRDLLALILSDPSDTPLRRAATLHISQSTYFRYLDALVTELVDYLNTPSPGKTHLADPATNLPIPLTPLIGADAILQRITGLLSDPHVRLVTLTGTGGIGKTRLAVQATCALLEQAKEHGSLSDGIFWVDLAPLRAPDLVLVEVARVLNLTERSGYPTLELLQHELRERELLLLLDNFEHLLAAAPLVTALLQETMRLKILVTSRAALNISGEHRLSIPPLSLPDLDQRLTPERLSEYSAVQFFVQRAQTVDDTFQFTPDNALAVAQLCIAFDGLPLALEMAARRINHLSPQKMLTMLGQRLQLLTGGAQDVAPRHQTLRSLIDWSYQLLDTHQQTAFQRLSVFANGWTLEAMEAVCALSDAEPQPFMFDVLAGLINHSIIFQQSGGAVPRFGMLETIREYAQEKLTVSGDEQAVRDHHAAYYLSLIKEWTELDSEPPLPTTLLESEYHNLRIALQWAIEQGQAGLASDFAVALWHYWTTIGSLNEGQYWVERVLVIRPHLRNSKRIRLLSAVGDILLYQSNFQQAQRYYDEMAELAQTLNRHDDLGTVLQGLGDIAFFTGEYLRARELYLESLTLYREIQNMNGVGWALDRLGNVAVEQGLVAEALAFYTESLAVFEALPLPTGAAHARAKLGLIAFQEGRYADAVRLFENNLAYLNPMNSDWHYAWLIEYLGQAVLAVGDLPRAAAFFRQSLSIHFDGKAYRLVAYSLHGLANVALEEGQARCAVRLLAAVERIYEQYPPIPSRRRQFETSLTRSHDGLDPLAFRLAWQEGRSMTLDQVVTEALEMPH